MANSFVRYTGNGSTTTYSVPFSYRSQDDVTVYLAGVATSAYTWNGAGTAITFSSAPASSTAIEIRRTTSQATKLVDYSSGSVLTENDLDTDSDQAFYMSQEAIDKSNDVITLDNADFQWNAQNKRLKNITDPTLAQDAVTKNYLENTWLSTANKTALTTVNANIANINAVNSNASNINSAVSNATNINTVATNIGSVNTVATDIAKVIAVANDLAEAVSEVETVADDLNEATSEIDTVATNITNVNTVGNNIANVNTVAGISGNVTTVAGNNANVSTVAGISGDVSTVAGISADVQAVENIASNVTTVAGIAGNVTTVAGVSSNVSTLAPIAANITTVAGISSNVSTVATNNANVSTVAGAIANVNTVGGAIANVNNVGGSIANVNTVAGNLSGVNYFGERYRVSASAPTTSLDVGDLYYDTTVDAMKVYGSSGWQNAGSSVNGTSQRYNYTATSGQTTFTGADNNGNTLAYDAGYIDVYLNGVKLLNGTDVTVSSGTSVVLASGATTGDVIDIVTYGTFSIATLNADNLSSGTVPDARITGAYTGITNLTMSGDLTVDTNTLYVDSVNNRVGIGTTSGVTNALLNINGGLNSITGLVGRALNDTFTLNGQTQPQYGINFSASIGVPSGISGYRGLAFATSSAERMRIDSSGNVLIGKSSLDYTTAGTIIRSDGSLFSTTNGTNTAVFERLTSDGDIIRFEKDNTTVGVIGTQNWGIGTNSPDGKLDISAPQTTSNKFTSPHLALTSSSQSNSDGFCGISYSSATITNYGWTVGSTRSSGGDGSSHFTFTNHYNSASGTERMRINSSGNLLIGTTSSNGKLTLLGSMYLDNRVTIGYASDSNSGSWLLGVSNYGAVDNGAMLNYRICTTGNNGGHVIRIKYRTRSGDAESGESNGAYCNGTTWVNASDQSMKTNITDIGYGLDTIKTLQPREFEWSGRGLKDIGFVAQELETKIPEVVSGEDGSKGVNYGALTAVLVKGMQEQQTIIEELKARITALETTN